MSNALRLATLAFVLVAAGASATQQGAQPPPPEPYPQQGGYQGGGGGEAYSCIDLDGPSTHGSLCFQDANRCEDERARAENSGVRATPCRGQTPVACYQRAAAPGPDNEVCAATAEDCDLWRLIEADRDGRAGRPCEWRHAGVAPQYR